MAVLHNRNVVVSDAVLTVPSSGNVVSFASAGITYPDSAQGAQIFFEKDSRSTDVVVARMRLTAQDPTATEGLGLKNYDYYEISSIDNLEGFRVMSLDSQDHTIQVFFVRFF